MNKRYITAANGQILVIDENANITERPYQEGIEEVLEQENIVEKIQNNIRTVEESIEELGEVENPKKAFWKMFGISNLGVILTEIPVFAVVVVGLGGFDALLALKHLSPSLANLLTVLFVSLTAALELYGLIDSLDYSHSKKYEYSEYNALQSQLEYLKQREQEEVTKLARMKQKLAEKAVVETKDYFNREINLDNLKKLRDELDEIYEENYRVPKKDKQKTLN